MAANRRDIYISGPLFTHAERAYLEAIDELCRKFGYATYLPHRDAGFAEARGPLRKRFFTKDLRMLLDSRVVVAVFNGAEVDSGTAWEVGFAYAHDKPVLGIREDLRMSEVNLMLTESARMLSSKASLARRLRSLLGRRTS